MGERSKFTRGALVIAQTIVIGLFELAAGAVQVSGCKHEI